MSYKILILGANGMLGGSIHRHLTELNKYNILGTVRSDRVKSNLVEKGYANIKSNIDAFEEPSVSAIISDFQPDYVVNCIGLIKQKETEDDKVASIRMNSLFPHVLSRICSKVGAKLIHFSTDCVFSGKHGNYNEESIPDEKGIYGRSKLLGEVNGNGHLTLRTSIIGHELSGNVSLIDWFLSQKEKVFGFSNAIFSGIPTIVIADIVDKIISSPKEVSGLYHLSAPPISKYDLLNIVKKKYGVITEIIEQKDFKVDKSLDSSALRKIIPLGFIDDWEFLVNEMHDEYLRFFAS